MWSKFRIEINMRVFITVVLDFNPIYIYRQLLLHNHRLLKANSSRFYYSLLARGNIAQPIISLRAKEFYITVPKNVVYSRQRSQSSEFRFLSRVECRGSNVEGEGKKSRVIKFGSKFAGKITCLML
jgi:hypothetical protein